MHHVGYGKAAAVVDGVDIYRKEPSPLRRIYVRKKAVGGKPCIVYKQVDPAVASLNFLKHILYLFRFFKVRAEGFGAAELLRESGYFILRAVIMQERCKTVAIKAAGNLRAYAARRAGYKSDFPI